MQEIKCPNCGEVFQVDETGYAQIVKQVRDKEFNREVEQRQAELMRQNKSDIELVKLQEQQSAAEVLREKEAELERIGRELETLKASRDSQVQKIASDKDSEIQKLTAEKESEIIRLKAQISASETEKQLAVSQAVQEKEAQLAENATEITKLKGQLTNKDNEIRLSEKSLREQYEEKLRLKDEQIEYYKDFKARQSTKMVGESLEQHCQNQFNQIRATAFPNAYFEKDNDARSGSKGDFIFREADEDGTEFISIMFEMKNEMEETRTKHKNEDFFKELDKDRREKNCEYAVLVSLLEADSELYNTGIVDVSYRYEKMYVIRPQFFIQMITLLRNAALNSLKYRRELEIVRNQQVDIMNFEENMNQFKEGFARNYRLASEKFQKAIEEIDKTIDHLEKTKKALLSSENNLRLANNKAEDLSIKRLTKNAPTVKAMFDEIKEEKQ
ncbi:MAG: DUF2130 domain-containing protein [Firmicutes bacterium]|nr:DUF2130 domain-containing protein [Bacillota bacterium]